MANGRVITGYSKPYVALYSVSDNTVSYTGGMPLARGVSVSIEPESGDGNDFYADNVTAESVGGTFTGGTVTLTVDGLKDAARKLVMGIVTESTITVGTGTTTSVKVYDYDDQQQAPYVGVGFIVRYMENGVTTYVPHIICKTVFSPEGLDAATQEEDIEFQTTELEATIMRDDSQYHRWQRVGEGQTTEDLAEAVIKNLLNIA